MSKKNIAIEFTSNIFGKLRPEIKSALQNVIDSPTEKNWERTYSIILSNKNRKMITLWQAVIKVDSTFPISRRGDRWRKVPSSETIKKAIAYAVFGDETKQDLN